jgi:hypothetical protein
MCTDPLSAHFSAFVAVIDGSLDSPSFNSDPLYDLLSVHLRYTCKEMRSLYGPGCEGTSGGQTRDQAEKYDSRYIDKLMNLSRRTQRFGSK